MHYIIDGYNLLFYIYDVIDPFDEKREEIIKWLILHFPSPTTIVFDSHLTSPYPFPSRKKRETLEIIYTPEKQTADNHIIEMLTWIKNPTIYTVVTADRHLALSVKDCNAKTMTPEAFLKKCHKKKHRNEKPARQETPATLAHLEKIFEERLKDSDTND